jgi:curved DNA-binding protein CbpA
MSMHFTHYELLGVESTASYEEIKRAYRANIAKYHPDQNSAPNANKLVAILNNAWETLQDPDRRAEYDRSIGLAGSGRSSKGESKRKAREEWEVQKEAEWRRRKEAAEAEQRQRDAEERQRREQEFARQREAAEELRKAQEAAARQRAAEEEQQRQQQAIEQQRQIAEAGRRRQLGLRRMFFAIAAIIIATIVYRTLSSVSKPSSNEVSGVVSTAQPVATPVSLIVKTSPPLNEGTVPNTGPTITYTATHKPIAASDVSSSPAVPEAMPKAKAAASTPQEVAQGIRAPAASGDGLPCSDRTITEVSDEGATVALSDGNSYAVSTSFMKYEASDWSTGDRVVLCRSGNAAAITNSDHLNQKVQAAYQGANAVQAISCSDRAITQVSDEGSTVTLSDGNSYIVSTSFMKYEASDWSTGDRVVLCRSGNAAAITNSDHLNQKVQAAYQGANAVQAVSCSNRRITQVLHEGATVSLNDGNSYAVATSFMRYEASDWSTGDRVILCRSGNAAAITNSDHLEQKIQAVRE